MLFSRQQPDAKRTRSAKRPAAPRPALASRLVGPARPVADPELANVLGEIAYLMNAQGALVSLHSARAVTPELLGACVSDGLADAWRSWLDHADLAAFGQSASLEPTWARHGDGRKAIDILMLPVSPIDGHNPMVVSMLFRQPNAATRDRAEHLFATRRPIAMGYFRLWQLQRVKARRLAALEAACNVTDLGIMLFTQAGSLDFANEAARELLAVGDGLRDYRQSVRATDISDDVKFQVALNHATAENEAATSVKGAPRRAPMVRLHRAGGEPLIALVVAAAERAVEPGDVAVMAYLFDPMQDLQRMLKPVCDAFKLSPVEAQLTGHLAAGMSISDAAKALKIQVPTARGYLKNIFVKTNTQRQGELVHLMLSNIFRMGRTILPQVL